MTRAPSPADVLSRHAPEHVDDVGLDAVLRRVQASPAEHGRSRGGIPRIALGASVAAASIAAAVFLPAALRAPEGTAAALDQLAATAASQPATVIPEGSYLHLVTVENQAQHHPDAPPIYPATLNSWTSAGGDLWRHDQLANGKQDWFRASPPPVAASMPGTTPQELAELPTDTQALLDHLRPIVSGSNSTDEAVFVYLADSLRTGYAPAETQRAMISAMARLPHIETERTQSFDGRPCLEVRFSEPERQGMTQSVCFDETTATLIEEEITLDGEFFFRSTVTHREVVGAVPAAVLANAGAPLP